MLLFLCLAFQSAPAAPALTITEGLVPFQVLQRGPDNTAAPTLKGQSSAAGTVAVRVARGDDASFLIDRAPVGEAKDGSFTLHLPAIPAGGPYRLTVHVVGADGKELATTALEPFFVGDLWLLTGQSNMEGVGDMVDVETPDPMVMCFESRERWARAEEPLHWLAESPDVVHWTFPPEEREARIAERRKNRPKGAGLGLSFGKEMVRLTKVPVGLVPCAHGGTSMEQWNPARAAEEGKSLYGSMLRRFRAVGGRVRGVLWYQGESDALAGKPEVVAAYAARFEELIAAMRKDCGDAELPFLYAQLCRLTDPKRTGEGWNLVQEVQRTLPDRVKRVACIPTIDLPMDDAIHVGTPGLRRLGARFARQAARLLGAAGLDTGPRLKTVVPEAQFRIRLVFEGVHGRLLPARNIGGFTLLVDGKPQDWIYDASVDPARPAEVVLRMRDKLPEKATLWYGFGLMPYCNLVDEADQAAPVFGPLVVR